MIIKLQLYKAYKFNVYFSPIANVMYKHSVGSYAGQLLLSYGSYPLAGGSRWCWCTDRLFTFMVF